jgi:sugar-specific transcriptional regulator TrmB
METTRNILKPLSGVGLSKYESKVYLTLVSEGVSTAKSVSDVTGIPYGKVYEIINSLSYKGFLMILPSKPMKYMAVSPKQAIVSAKKDVADRFVRLESTILEHLGSDFEKSKNFSPVSSSFLLVNGRSNAVRKVEELIKSAKKNIHVHCSANSLSRLMLHKEVLKEASVRGVKIFIAGVINDENLDEIKSLSFCDIRSINRSRNNFVSVDGRDSLIVESMPDDDNLLYGRDIGIFASSASFTKFIDNFFVSDFEKAKAFKF